MVKLYVSLLAVALATGPALAFSSEYKRGELVDRRNSGMLYGRDLEFGDFLETRTFSPIKTFLHHAATSKAAQGPGKKALSGLRSVLMTAGSGAKKLREVSKNHGTKSIENLHHTTGAISDLGALYHNTNRYNFNAPPATPSATPSATPATHKRRDLEDLFERSLDDEELFEREYYDLDERDIIDDLD